MTSSQSPSGVSGPHLQEVRTLCHEREPSWRELSHAFEMEGRVGAG
ncbi:MULTISPECIES: hypothetical protein [unclassified Corallococcus]|nr:MULTISPECIES: hypothetical protein [unclassified Corallococcus]MBN9686919.1 hypothetical protein [Corallococcus sp. NCSPR001]WAS89247.1 hypothetical protein O0N60_20250 [Corallococcus sp. NCRR]